MLTATLGKWVFTVAWVSEVGGLYETALLLDTQFSFLLIWDNNMFREYLLFMRDQVQVETR